MMNVKSKNPKAFGVFQGDVIIRTALIAALRDMRQNPWLLDYVFRGLACDSLTESDYGQREIDKAKQWFISTDIPVVQAYRPGSNPKMPCISIVLRESSEDQNSLGDVHYETHEDLDEPWPIEIGPFSPKYTPQNGELVVPEYVLKSRPLSTSQVIVDREGGVHDILDVAGNVLTLKPRLSVSFENATIRGKRPAYSVALESAFFRESYVIGVHAQAEPIHALYLHSIVVFALLRYKQQYFEARGFERSAISSTELDVNPAFEDQFVFSRYVSITGFVQHFWPKAIAPKLQVVETMPSVSRSVEDASESLWSANGSRLTFRKQ